MTIYNSSYRIKKLLAASLISLPILTACVSSSKFDDLQQKNNELAADNKALEAGADFLIEELFLQDDQIIQLQKEQEQLAAGFSELILAGMIEMELLADGLHLVLAEEILFTSSETQLNPAGKEVIVEVAKELVDFEYQIVVIGHTDNVAVGKTLREKFPSNWEVAAARAASVVRTLEAENVPAERLAVASFGSTHPLASNDSAEGRAQNRRVEIRLRPVVRQP